MHADDLACDCPSALPAVALGASLVLAPLALLAARMAWGIARDPLARHFAGWPW